MRASEHIIDLRSDTVTQPTPAMRAAMADVQLGDDGYAEDPTVNRLEAMAAELLGKEAALLVSSGTQANLTALLALTQPGQEIILEAESHMLFNEVAGFARIAGLSVRALNGHYGVLDPRDVEATIRPPGLLFPETGLVCIENTHNRAGGTVWTPDQIRTVADVAHSHGIRVYVDGARFFNAVVALDVPPQVLAQEVDVVGFCLSKGLCCPAGSLVVGPRDVIQRARKARQLLGGRMRQTGWIAAPGIIALETLVERLAEDHRLARDLGERLTAIEGLRVDLKAVQTNMVRLDVAGLGPEVGPTRLSQALAMRNVKANPAGEYVIRLVTHYGITEEDIDYVVEAAADAAQELRLARATA